MNENQMLDALEKRTMNEIKRQHEPVFGLLGQAIQMRAAQRMYAASRTTEDMRAMHLAEQRFDRTVEEFNDALKGG